MSSNPPPGDAGPPPRTVKAALVAPLRITARVLLGLLGAIALALFVGWLSLHWLILPHIEEWRVPIEERASRLLGAPVQIGSIQVRSGGWMPAIDLRDVRVLDPERRVALELPRVAAAISARSLLALELRLDQLLIDGASLDVRRDASGRIRVAGLDFGGSLVAGADDGAAADWLFRQHELVIRGGSVRWTDEQRQAPPLVLGEVEIVVRNGLREHALRLDATPPAGWGERFSVRGRFSQPLFARAGDWRRWSGTAYADLPRADLRELRRHISLPFELSEGDGALRGWLELAEGQLRSVTVDLALRAVALRLDPAVEPLEFEQIEGQISAEQDGAGTSVAVRRFGFVTGDGIRWPRGDLRVAWRQADGQPIEGGELSADRLDVGVMAEIAERVPLGAALRKLLVQVAPKGTITQLSTRWEGPLDAPDRYRVTGLLSGLTLTAQPGGTRGAIGRPGLSNATVQLDAHEGGGEARIGLGDGSLELPGVFSDSTLPFERLDAKLAWTIEPAKRADALPRITVKVGEARFANADARGELSATWRTGAGAGMARGGRYPGELELDGSIVDGRATRTARYLPLGLPESVRSYVERAVRAGTIAKATFRVRGDLWDFPFHNARRSRDGEFRIAAQLEDLSFAYVPGDAASAPRAAAEAPGETWPPLTAASGELIVDRSALEIRNARARLSGVEWSRIQGRIASLGEQPQLEIDGNARGALADMLGFVNATPVGGWTSRALAGATGSGSAELKLALAIPLEQPEASVVKGSLVLAGNDVRLSADTPLLAGAKARIDFSERGYSVNAASARALGGEVTFSGGLERDGVPRFSGQGTLSAEALRQAPELGSAARLAASLSGQMGYRATLAFAGGQPQIGLTSSMVGVAIDLPAPLGKAAATPLPLRLLTTVDEASAGAAPRETLQIDLGAVLQARFVRDLAGESSRPVRGAIRVVEPAPGRAAEAAATPTGEPLALPASGVSALVVVNRLDVDDWQAAATRLLAEPGRPGSAAAAAATFSFDPSGGAGYVPDRIGLRVGQLETGSRRLTNVVAGLSQDDGLWRANIDSDQLDGYLEYRPARRGAPVSAGAGRVYARLTRLSLPRGEAEHVESLLEEQPASIPALDIVVDEFELRGKRLGRLEIEAAHGGSGGRDAAREWQLSKFNLVTPEAKLTATGTWGGAATPAGRRRAAMTFTLALADSGALIERLGMGKLVSGGKGSLSGQVSWPGSPLAPDVARMTGELKVAIESGQFLQVDPGAARLLGVLSMQSLPRRLQFDFRDLFEAGFAFDNVAGDVQIGQGTARTNNLRMRGASAAVLMEGSADLERETQDLRVVVVPEINAGTASLAFAIINPAIGLGTFLAQYFLRAPLMAANTREFHVTGPWDEPKVERVERSGAGQSRPESPSAAAEAAPGVRR